MRIKNRYSMNSETTSNYFYLYKWGIRKNKKQKQMANNQLCKQANTNENLMTEFLCEIDLKMFYLSIFYSIDNWK